MLDLPRGVGLADTQGLHWRKPVGVSFWLDEIRILIPTPRVLGPPDVVDEGNYMWCVSKEFSYVKAAKDNFSLTVHIYGPYLTEDVALNVCKALREREEETPSQRGVDEKYTFVPWKMESGVKPSE